MALMSSELSSLKNLVTEKLMGNTEKVAKSTDE
jgi:hypothetical protein